MQRAGITQTQLAAEIGAKQPTVGKLLRGETRATRFLDRIADALDTTPLFLRGETDNPDRSHVPQVLSRAELSHEMGLVKLREIDLNFGMGSSYLDVPVTESIRHFSRDWLQEYTKADPDKLFFARGIGDSMSPTLHDHDLLLVDCSRQTLNIHDKIWAIAYGGCGAIKRLRPLPDGSVEIISDNPLVPNAIAVDGELHILGRVVAYQRRI